MATTINGSIPAPVLRWREGDTVTIHVTDHLNFSYLIGKFMFEIIPNWHPIFVHFTVALLSIAVVFYYLAQVVSSGDLKQQWLAVARWNLWTGTLFAVATGITGWLAFNSVVHDEPSHVAMSVHRNWALGTLAIFIPVAVWSGWQAYKRKASSPLLLIVLAIGLAVLASTAWHGGEAVYRYGLGVMQLPKAELPEHGHQIETRNTDGHNHEHK